MRVLIPTSTFPLRRDDALPRFVFDLARHLARHGEVTVLAPGAPGAPRHERWDGVEVLRFDYFLPRSLQRLAYGHGMGGNLRASWWARLQVPGFGLAQVQALRALLARRRFDVVNSHWLLPQGLCSALAGAQRRAAHVVTLHGGDAHLAAGRAPARRAARFVAARTDAFVAVSESVRERLDAALGHPSGAFVLPMGVDLERFAPGAAAPESPFPDGYLLYVGRLSPIKGVADLLRALPAVRQRHPGVGLVVAGEGSEAASLRAAAAAPALRDAVHFTGGVDASAVAGWLRGCRVAVLPSTQREDGRAEGLPAVLLEALASGARVVATATGGIPELLRHGENGWLCRHADADDLAEKLVAALDDPPGSRVPERARASASALAWPAVAERTLEIFAAVSRRGRTSDGGCRRARGATPAGG